MLYTEKEGKNTITISGTDNLIKLRVDCQYGTLASVSFYSLKLVMVGCGKAETVRLARDLKGKTIEFNGSAGNPDGGQLKIIHTIYEENGNKLTYIFPDDYTGTPDFNATDKQLSYVFCVKFS